MCWSLDFFLRSILQYIEWACFRNAILILLPLLMWVAPLSILLKVAMLDALAFLNRWRSLDRKLIIPIEKHKQSNALRFKLLAQYFQRQHFQRAITTDFFS